MKCNYGCWALSHASVRQQLTRQLTPVRQARWEVSDGWLINLPLGRLNIRMIFGQPQGSRIGQHYYSILVKRAQRLEEARRYFEPLFIQYLLPHVLNRSFK